MKRNLENNNIYQEIKNKFDEEYAQFSSKLIPNCDYKQIGLRIGQAKNIAKKYANTQEGLTYLKSKHESIDERNVQGLMLGYLNKDFDEVIKYVEIFLPYIDNWETCDITVSNLKIFKKNTSKLRFYLKKWLNSDQFFIKRFAIVVLLDYFLDEAFDENDLQILSKINCENYYVNMALAWYFSVALVKQYDSAIVYFEQSKFANKFVKNKAIQKAIESFRINKDKKEYLKCLKYL